MGEVEPGQDLDPPRAVGARAPAPPPPRRPAPPPPPPPPPSPAFRTKVRAAARRAQQHKERWLDVQLPRDATTAQHSKLREDILAFADHVAQGAAV